ncbi:MAG: malate dehydrogenase [Chloroflexi bacterium]|nr:MAG: malate dehydrogenase [Chloroflexota bacterium]
MLAPALNPREAACLSRRLHRGAVQTASHPHKAPPGVRTQPGQPARLRACRRLPALPAACDNPARRSPMAKRGEIRMLERFHVRPEDEVRVLAEDLHETTTSIFTAMGVPPDEAAEAADVLVMADLRGVESHGVSNMLRFYVSSYRDGTMNPRPQLTVLRERPGTATLDGDRGLGIVHGRRAMELAIEKARNVGVGAVTLNNSRHLGAVGHFARIATEHDMVGMCLSAAGNTVVPTFGAITRLGTNPISIAAPTGSLPVFLFDAATSAVAGNKIMLARRLGAEMAPGWVAAEDGTPLMHPTPAPAGYGLDLRQLPLGGNREQGSHKGYGLALMVEILSAILSGAPALVVDKTTGYKHFFAAWDIEAFCDLDVFKRNMDDLLQTMLDTPPAPGEQRVIYPGLPEYEAEEERTERGIPLHPEVIAWFDTTTDELGLARLRR